MNRQNNLKKYNLVLIFFLLIFFPKGDYLNAQSIRLEENYKLVEYDSIRIKKYLSLSESFLESDPFLSNQFSKKGIKVFRRSKEVDSVNLIHYFVRLNLIHALSLSNIDEHEDAELVLDNLRDFISQENNKNWDLLINDAKADLLVNSASFEQAIYFILSYQDQLDQGLFSTNYNNLRLMKAYNGEGSYQKALQHGRLFEKGLFPSDSIEIKTDLYINYMKAFISNENMDSIEIYHDRLKDLQNEFTGERFYQTQLLTIEYLILKDDQSEYIEKANSLIKLLNRDNENFKRLWDLLNRYPATMGLSLKKQPGLDSTSLELYNANLDMMDIYFNGDESDIGNGDKNFYYKLSFLLVGLFIVSLWFFLSYRKNKPQTKETLERQKSYYSNIIKNERKERELLDSLISKRDNDLDNLAKQVIKKNNLIKEMEEQLKEEKKIIKVDDTIQELKQQLEVDSTNNALTERVDHLSQEFIKKLSTDFPDLTPTEIKICALLRSGFYSKEISSILFVAHRTVHNHRNSIRRKLKLKQSESLELMLNQI